MNTYKQSARARLVAARIEAVRDFCQKAIDRDFNPNYPQVLTDRAWCARSVLNILDGKIDQQLT